MTDPALARRARPRRQRGSIAGAWGALVLIVVDLASQIVLIAIGVYVVMGDSSLFDPSDEIDAAAVAVPLLLWCAFGTAYWVGAVIACFVSSRRRPVPRGTPQAEGPLSRLVDRLETHPAARVISTSATFLASLVGLAAAVQLLWLRNDPDWALFISVLAVWAMLLSWTLFHWGYARIYARAYRLAKGTKPLEFPGEDEPGLADFVYLAFTNATAFSSADVTVLTRRMRWTIAWHVSLSFFLNSLIIVLAVNTVLQN